MDKHEDTRRYRFRVRAPGGQELVSDIAELRLPPGAPAEAERPEGGRAADPMLANPRWSAQTFADGDRGVLRVDAPGLDGRKVRFRVERRSGEEWEPYQTADGQVEAGAAEATVELHPGAGDEADLRFTCELLNEP